MQTPKLHLKHDLDWRNPDCPEQRAHWAQDIAGDMAKVNAGLANCAPLQTHDLTIKSRYPTNGSILFYQIAPSRNSTARRSEHQYGRLAGHQPTMLIAQLGYMGRPHNLLLNRTPLQGMCPRECTAGCLPLRLHKTHHESFMQRSGGHKLFAVLRGGRQGAVGVAVVGA